DGEDRAEADEGVRGAEDDRGGALQGGGDAAGELGLFDPGEADGADGVGVAATDEVFLEGEFANRRLYHRHDPLGPHPAGGRVGVTSVRLWPSRRSWLR